MYDSRSISKTNLAMKANAFASTFYFLQPHKATLKNKKSLQATAPDSADISGKLTQQTNGRKEERTDNSTYKKLAVQCSADTFVVKIANFL